MEATKPIDNQYRVQILLRHLFGLQTVSHFEDLPSELNPETLAYCIDTEKVNVYPDGLMITPLGIRHYFSSLVANDNPIKFERIWDVLPHVPIYVYVS